MEETHNKEALKVLERVSRLIKKKMDETKSEDFYNIIIQFEEWKILLQDQIKKPSKGKASDKGKIS